MARFLLISGLLVAGSFHCHAQALPLPDHPPIPPATPDTIMATLPAAPANWKITVSRAYNAFVDWQFTIAKREYLEIPPPPLPGQPVKVPGVTYLYVTDSAFWPGRNNTFADPKWGTGPNEERTTLEGYPAFKIHPKPDDKDGDEQVIFWVKQRYLVRVVTSHQAKSDDEKWAKLVNIKGLTDITDDGPKTLPAPLTMVVVDELEPANSRSFLYFGPTGH